MNTSRLDLLWDTKCFLWGLALIVWPHVVWSAPVSIRATLSTATVYVGDSVELELRITGIQDLEPPDITHPDIDIRRSYGQSFNNTSLTIVQGQTTRQEAFGYLARYELRPRIAGMLQIPPITVTHKGQTYTSNPLTLVVKEPTGQDYLLVTVGTDKPSYVLGEVVTVTLTMSLRALTLNGADLDIDPFFPKQPPHVQIPWFEQLGDWKTASLETFAEPLLGKKQPGFHINDYYNQGNLFGNDRLVFTLPRQTVRLTRPDGTFTYYTYTLQKTFRPIRAGRQTIPAVLVKATLPTQIDDRGQAQHVERVVASSQPLAVLIQPVPSDGQPPSFSGGVGRFQLNASATPTSLKVGDPLTLTVTVYGEAESLLETVHPPPLHDQSAVAQDFKVAGDPPTVKTAANTKTFIYTLRPRHERVSAVPPLAMAYYDPVTGRFQELHSQAIPLQVSSAPTMQPSAIVGSDDTQPAKSHLGQQLTEGLLANYTGPEVLVPQQAMFHVTPFVIALLAVPPSLFFLLLLGRTWSQRKPRLPDQPRNKRPAQVALLAFQHLQHNQEASEADVCDGVYQALVHYLSNKLNLPSNIGLTAADIVQQLHTHNAAQETIDQATTLFSLCDSARYAPGTLAVTQVTSLLDIATTFVKRVEAERTL